MVKEGAKAPAFRLASDSGDMVALKDFVGRRVVLYFYPKDDTSGCTLEARNFQEELASFTKKGAVILGVSRDSVDSHRKFKKKYGLEFPLLADVDGTVCEKYGVWVEKSMYGRKYMGIERTTFVIDEAGRILRIFPKVKVPGHCAAVMETL